MLIILVIGMTKISKYSCNKKLGGASNEQYRARRDLMSLNIILILISEKSDS